MKRMLPITCFLLSGALCPLLSQEFSYLTYLNEKTGTLSASVSDINPSTGAVTVNGVDTSQPTVPFTFIWGDGTSNPGWFPGNHIYADTGRNYEIKVCSRKDTVSFNALFREPGITRKELSDKIYVDILNKQQHLPARWYNPVDLNPFSRLDFGVITDATIKYVATVMADILLGYCGEFLWYCEEQTFRQLIFNGGYNIGGYSLWYTDPPSLAINPDGLKGSVWWGIIGHELAHNYTLNYPGTYHIGGRIDGQANAIYSETMARIIAMSMGHDLINRHDEYGISPELTGLIRNDFVNGFKGMHNDYLKYLDAGKPFNSWNNPGTTVDETYLTFNALSFEFLIRAEQTEHTVAYHAKRMMEFFSHFNASWELRYDRLNQSEEGNIFRSTMMTAAISFALNDDLRDEFRDLGFPVSDDIFNDLIAEASTGIQTIPDIDELIVYPNPSGSIITVTGFPPEAISCKIRVLDILGRRIMMNDLRLINDRVTIDLTPLPVGQYEIIISCPMKTWNKNIVKIQ